MIRMRFGERVFALLLRLYPREFRQEYHDDLIAFFRQDRQHPKYGAGPLRPVRFWGATLRDLVRAAWDRRRDRPTGDARISRSSAPWFGRLQADVRDGWRSLWSAPSVTLSAFVILTLGIGASTAIFSVVDAVALRGLPFDGANRLISIAETTLPDGRPVTVAPQNYEVFRERQDVFESIGASASGGRLTTVDLPAETLWLVRVTSSLFDVLRVSPVIGRPFALSDQVPGAPRVAIVSHSVWRRRFNGRPDIVGRRLLLETSSEPIVRSEWEIVGVMPEGFTYPIGSGLAGAVDVWTPVVPRPQDLVRDQGRTYNLSVVGRLRAGETLERADAQIRVIHASLATQYPDWFADRGILVRRLQDAVVSARVRDWMLFLLGAVGFVLLIACLNVANLLLARANTRSREIAVRSALGARRWDLSRALLVESLMLSMVGAMGGVLLAFWAVTILRASLPESLPRLAMVAVDLRVLGVTALAAVITGVGFGMLPALHVGRADVAGTLRQSGRSHTTGTGRLRTTLVAIEVASAVVLLTAAGLFLASFMRVMQIDLGLDPRHVMAVSVAPKIISSAELAPSSPSGARTEVVSVQSLTLAALDRARVVPGVTAISALTLGLPLSGNSLTGSVVAPGRAEPFSGEDELWLHGVGAGYLDVVRGRLFRGRWIADSDTSGSLPVVVLSEEAVRRYFGPREALGQTILIEGYARTVIGIVHNMRLGGPERPIQPEGYIPYLQTDQKNADLVFRTGPDPATVLPGVLSAIRSVVPKAGAGDAETIELHFARIVAQRKFNMVVLVLFGVVAIVIAAVGIYGLMAHLVTERTREIGVRIALGAAPAKILEMVLRRATVLLSVGLGAGLLAAGALERFVRAFLFDAAPHDARVYAAVAIVLLVVGLMAAAGPARRAARVDPLVALRTE